MSTTTQTPLRPNAEASAIPEASRERTMKAITQDRYGSADVLTFGEVERPVGKDDEVLVRVRAASLNHADPTLVRGEPYVLRLAFGLNAPKSSVRGHDRAGVWDCRWFRSCA